ncbi:MAG: hypothetical protein LM550_13260 [Candidatus Contendobacter sp.]|jgi:hypothetical protein|nr:hypothetical protein [Candidatus Contendobacter sp.]
MRATLAMLRSLLINIAATFPLFSLNFIDAPLFARRESWMISSAREIAKGPSGQIGFKAIAIFGINQVALIPKIIATIRYCIRDRKKHREYGHDKQSSHKNLLT